MRISLLTLLPALVICAGIDLALVKSMLRLSVAPALRRAYTWLTALTALLVIFLIAVPKKDCSDGLLEVLTYIVFFIISQYSAKFLALIPAALLSWRRASSKIVRWVPLAIAATVFGSMWWGTFVTRFSTNVNEVDIPLTNLPEAFNGYKIVQISDIHIASFGHDTNFIAQVVDEVNALKPDLIVFTGDIVTRKTSELQPFVSTLARLSAPDGVLAVKGNHDYGNYCHWPSEAHHQANNRLLDSLFAAMHWRLLTNASDTITRGSQFITVTGVEYESMFANEDVFARDLHKAIDIQAAKDSGCHILLYHSPQKWDQDIAALNTFNLTLSGHTHAMQMEVLGLSPAALRYDRWAGLYQHDGSYLYVNRGIGTVGFPSRIGCHPEITLLTLKSTH